MRQQKNQVRRRAEDFQNTIACALLPLALFLAPFQTFAAGNTLTLPDNNSNLVVENARVSGGTTNLLFWTYPGMADPDAGKSCALNFYTVKLQPGLVTVNAQAAARGVCGNGLSNAVLLDNGDVQIMAMDRLERWRKGAQISKQSFSSLDTTRGGQWYGMNAWGDTVLAVPDSAGAGLDVVSLDADFKQRWKLHLSEPGQRLMVESLWAIQGGGALFHVGQLPADNSRLSSENFLYFIAPDGKLPDPVQISASDEPDIQKLMALGQADLQQAFARIGQSNPETIKRLSVDVRDDGGFDVLLLRQGGVEGREGHFLLKFGPDGNLQSEFAVTDPIAPYGLENWSEFYVEGRNLVVLSVVSASQPAVQSGRKKYNQIVISTIDLDRRTHTSRLVPLDLRYLEAAMNAGDAEQQYLENLPGGEPVLLTRLGSVPLAVSRGYLSRRPALRLDEGTQDLLVYTEAFDQQQATASRRAARDQGNDQRAAVKQQLGSDVAEAAGMTPEQFNALSKEEQKEAMLRSGNYEALMAATVSPGQPGSGVPGLSPEMAAQVAAAMAQVQQAMGQSGMPTAPDTTAVDSNTASTDFYMSVMDVFSISTGGIVLTGAVKSGRVSVGNSICLVSTTTGKHLIKVDGIEMRGGAETAVKGDRPGLRTNSISKSKVKKGDELRSSCAPD